MNTISYTAARANLAKTIDQVCNDHAPIMITRSQAKTTVLISLEDYESIMETNYLLKSPANAAHLKSAIEEIETMITKKTKSKKAC